MKRVTLFLLMSVATLSLSCQPAAQNSNGNVNKNAKSNDNGVEALVAAGDKQVAISVTEDPDVTIQAFPSPVHLHPSKNQKIRWCAYNNTEDKVIDWVRIEAKADPGIPDPFDCGLPITDNSDIDPGHSDCTKWCKAKTPPTGLEYFYYKVVVKLKDVETPFELDPQVIISDGKKDKKSAGSSNANSNRR
ncbi:MAG TPA: hypothetical protein VNS63_08015 [Blastocatellia bacterium]|nr:hypothetical protein [Blastocatellia bacterium]